MWKRFTAENTRNWIDMLDNLLLDYNNKFHSTIKMTPVEASRQTNKMEVLLNQNQLTPTLEKPKFKVGDQVRISRIKGLFEKGYLPNWSEALYVVQEVKKTIPITYIVKDTNGEVIAGSFYTEELQKSSQEVFRIEKIIRKKKIKGVPHGLVKWLGYDSKFNEWKPMSELERLI